MGLGLKVAAVDAWADAAILAALVGAASDAERRAMELCEEIGMHPSLGPLPETRWLTGALAGNNVTSTP